MSTYIFTANNAVQTSANIATDKVRISTTSGNGILFATGYPNVAGTGNITTSTSSVEVTGNGTAFLTELSRGYWIGDDGGNTVGIVNTIIDDGNLTLQANAEVTLADIGFTLNPYGVPYVDDTLDASNCPRASGIIPAQTMANSIYVGQGNVVTFIAVSGDSNISITELGMPHANTGTSGF